MVITALTERQIKILATPAEVKEFEKRIILGEVLKGRVKRVLSPERALVNFKGTNLLSQTPSPFEVGQHVFVQVMQIRPKVVMQLLKDEKRKIGPCKYSKRDLIDLLLSIGEEASDENIEIIKGLIEYGLPVGKELMARVKKILKDKERRGEEAIESAISSLADQQKWTDFEALPRVDIKI